VGRSRRPAGRTWTGRQRIGAFGEIVSMGIMCVPPLGLVIDHLFEA
jgi:hypothetical protein